jgi:hypothetical protein
MQKAQVRGEVVGPKAAAQQLLGSSELAAMPNEEQSGPRNDQAESWEELLGQVLTVWNSMAKERLPVWVFTPMEVKALSGAWAPVAEKYAGPSLSVEAAAVLVTASVVLPRAAVTYKRNSRQQRTRRHGEEENHQEEQGQEKHQEVESVEGSHGGHVDELANQSQELYQNELPQE